MILNSTRCTTPALTWSESRTYLMAALFIVGNIVVPQLCHLIPQGGLIFLPIYFFTLVGALGYGWRVGLITALLSPVLNCVLFGMPPVASLPVIEMKSVVLATIAGYAAWRWGRPTLLLMIGVVLSAYIAGGLIEWAMTMSLNTATQDLTLGLPGIAIQILLGWAILRQLKTKN